jgi:ornithine cyclodeaminase
LSYSASASPNAVPTEHGLIAHVDVLTLTESEIRSLVDLDEARRWVRDAFVSFADGKAILPSPMEMQLPGVDGELHVKAAYLEGFSCFAVKAATGFYRNRDAGLPTLGGLVMVFDATTGFPRAVLLDNGYLTEIRTAAAGALAAEVLARPDSAVVAVLGAGGQARFQVEALRRVRPIRHLRAWSRTAERARGFAAEMAERFGLEATACGSAQEAVAGADIVLTVTPARQPIVEADWLGPGVHVTAVGSDFPDKQELAPEILARANKYVADSIEQCIRSGELHHAVAAGVMMAHQVHAELGEVLAGRKPGRETAEELTVADLTGVGIQDAAMANLMVASAGRGA